MKCVRLSLWATAGFAACLHAPTPSLAQSLGSAVTFAIVGGSAVNANGTGSIINGDVGVSPGTSITGFPAGATVVPPFTTHANDGMAIAAQTSVTALYTSLVGAGPCSPLGMQLNGVMVGPGIYCFSSTADLAATGTLTLNGAGTYIFEVGSALTANVLSNVLLINGADPCDVFWQVTSAATINGTSFAGNIVAQAGVTLGAGTLPLPVTLTGRALATAAGNVTLAGFDTVGGCSAAETPTDTPSSTATNTPSSTATGTPSSTATDTPTNLATSTPTPSSTNSPLATATPTDTATTTPTSAASATETLLPAQTPSQTATTTPIATATTSPTNSSTDTPTASQTPTLTPSLSATASVTQTETPTVTATATETVTLLPTQVNTPTNTATRTPINTPSATPSSTPSSTRTVTRTRPPIPVVPSPFSPAGVLLIGGLSIALLWAVRRMGRAGI